MHIEKETYNEALVKLRHDLRQPKTYKNKDIDLSRSNQNYSFNTWNPFEKFKSRIDQVYIYGKDGKNKDKINYMCSIVVQYPDNCPISEEEFFTDIVSIFNMRFGIENVISAVVHKDEWVKDNKNNKDRSRAHLHYKVMPCVKLSDPKKGYTEKLCAKDVVNREMLKTFHQDIEADFLEKYGIKLSLRSQEPRKYLNNIYEYKELKARNDALKEKYNQLVDLYNNALNKVISLNDYINYQKSKERTR